MLLALDAPIFYEFLAQQQLLSSIFIALNDESFLVREIASRLLAILATYNPALVKPFLRKTLLELLTTLDNRQSFSADALNRRQSAELIGDLIEAASVETMKPYVSRIICVLLRQLTLGDDTEVEISILGTIGKLAKVAGQELRQYFNDILPILVEALQHTSHTSTMEDESGTPPPVIIDNEKSNKPLTPLVIKKCVALQTLGHVIESTRFVIQPYLHYKKLLSAILESLKSDEHKCVRREAIQVLGVIGALDPLLHRENVRQVQQVDKIQRLCAKRKEKRMKIRAEKSTQKSGGHTISASIPIPFANKSAQDLKTTESESKRDPLCEEEDKLRETDVNELSQLPPALLLNDDDEYDTKANDFLSKSNLLLLTGADDPQFCSYIALRSLILITKDPTLYMYYRPALINITKIFEDLAIDCIPYLQYIIPPILQNLQRFRDPQIRAMLLFQLSRLTAIVKSHIRSYLPQIFQLLHVLWDENSSMLLMMNAMRMSVRKKSNDKSAAVLTSVPNTMNNSSFAAALAASNTGLPVLTSLPPSPFIRPRNESYDNYNTYPATQSFNMSLHPLMRKRNSLSLSKDEEKNESHNMGSEPPLLDISGARSISSNINVIHKQTTNQVAQTAAAAIVNVGGMLSKSNIRKHLALQTMSLKLMIEICGAICDEFTQHLSSLLPKLLNVLHNDISSQRKSSIAVLQALVIFGSHLQQFMFLVLPPIIALIENEDIPMSVRVQSIKCVGCLLTKCRMTGYTSRIMHPLTRILDTSNVKVLVCAAIGALCLLLLRMGNDWILFNTIFNKVLFFMFYIFVIFLILAYI